MKLNYIIKKDDNFVNLKELVKTQFQISDRLFLKLKKKESLARQMICKGFFFA